MAYTWSPDLETGNAAIDSQHRQLIDAVNALFEAHHSGKGHQEVERTLEFLVSYTLKHFADEEKLQKKHDYPDYLVHKNIHAEFKCSVQALIKRWTQEGPSNEFINDVYATIGEWLLCHIKGDDFKMATYVRNKEKKV